MEEEGVASNGSPKEAPEMEFSGGMTLLTKGQAHEDLMGIWGLD